jgi:hypothetical protein
LRLSYELPRNRVAQQTHTLSLLHTQHYVTISFKGAALWEDFFRSRKALKNVIALLRKL